MVTTDLHVPPAERPRAGVRFFWFLARAALAASVAAGSLSLVEHQGRLVREEGLLQYPLATALRQSGIAVVETDLLVTARLGESLAPSFADLKEIASRIAQRMPRGAPVSLWSEEGDGYAVVYLEGAEPLGGRWIASARYVEGEQEGVGRVEAGVHRRFHGLPDDLPRLYHATAHLVQRGAGVSARLEGKAAFRGRPTSGGERREIAGGLLGGVGAELRYEEVQGDRLVAAGWTPRLAGRSQVGRQAVNVVVTVTRFGLDEWVEVETPIL